MRMHNILSIPPVTHCGVYNPTHNIPTKKNIRVLESEGYQEELLRLHQKEQIDQMQNLEHSMATGVEELHYLGPIFDGRLPIQNQMDYFYFGLE